MFMKQSFLLRNWKRIVSAGLSFAVAASLCSTAPVFAAPSENKESKSGTEIVPVKDKTPVTNKAGSISMSQLEDNETTGGPFPKGTAGNNVFRIPAMITMQNGELLAIADARYDQPNDGNGLDTIASVSTDGGKTWEYSFPIYLPDSYRDSLRNSTASIDPGLLEGPDGTIYCIADVFPTEYSVQNVGARAGTGYVEINGRQRLALTDDYGDVGTAPVDEGDERYLYYVGEFKDGYAQILTREDHAPTGYAVDEWYNLYTVGGNGEYLDDLKQPQINNEDHQVQQNVYYRDSKFHVYQTGYIWMVTSKDHGRTWEHPRDLVPQIKREDDQALLISPGCGLTTSDGTLVIGCYNHQGAENASLLYSSDNGVTWNRTADINTGSSENEVVELEDGTIRMFYRGGSGKISYADFTKNAAGGYDVGEPVSIDACPVTSTCNMGAIRYSKKINGKQAILVSCPEGSGRSNGKIFTLLVEDDKSMSLYHKLHVEGSEQDFVYSTLTELWDGTVGLLWEEGDRTAKIWYERYDVSEFAPGAALENLDGSSGAEQFSVSLEKGESYTKTYTVEEAPSGGLVQVAPDEDVATAKAELKVNSSVKAPVFAHSANNEDVATAYATSTADATLLELTDVEYVFKKNGDKYQIKNESTGKFLTFNAATAGGDNFHSETAADVTVTASDNGTIVFKSEYTDGGGNAAKRYPILYTQYQAFNAQSSTGQGKSIYDFTLWEKRSDGAAGDSGIPGYQKVTATADNLDGKSVLVTVENDGHIFLLYPENGSHKQTKLIASASQTGGETARGSIPEPVISTKNDIVVTITGVNQGATKAVIDGKEYHIQVTDQRVFKPVEENIEILCVAEYQVLSGSERADVTEINLEPALYDHAGAKDSSIESFSKKKNETISFADAEFTFAKKEGDNEWEVKSGDLYMVHIKEEGGTTALFSQTAGTILFTPTGDGRFNICRKSGGRYLIFHAPLMNFNAMGSLADQDSYKFTLWKKDDAATDGLIPGYKKVEAGKGIEDGGVYLVGYIFEEDHAIILYPRPGINVGEASEANSVTKLVRIPRKLQITPKAVGSFQIVVDGEEYNYQFVDSNCSHPVDKKIVKGHIDAECQKEGYTGDAVCGDCGVMLEEGQAIPATGHDYGTPTQTQALTESENGISLYVCKNDSSHQKKTIVYASAYKQLKELFTQSPEEIDAKKDLYSEACVAALKSAYDAGNALAAQAANTQTNEGMYGAIEAFTTAKASLHSDRDALEQGLSNCLATVKPTHDAGKQEAHAQADWDAFVAAYEAASGADVAAKTYAELQTLTGSLKDSHDKLLSEAGKGSLRKLYDAHKDKQQGEYSNKTWGVFAAALEAANGVLNKADATLQEIKAAEQALKEAVDGLKTVEEESIPVPGGIAYKAPKAGAYPKAAAVTADENDVKHAFAVTDWTEETPTLVRNDASAAAAVVNKQGIWGFNDQLRSSSQKYNVNGAKAMAITLKLWLNTIQTSSQAEILAKGEQYSLQLKNGKLTLWMLNNAYPTEQVTLDAEADINKWLDVVIVIDGASGKQRLYVDGRSSETDDRVVNLTSSSEPFTIGWRSGGDGIPFTEDIGYLADIKFYNCGADDVTEGLTRDYEAVVNCLHAMTPSAIISADLFDAKTVWSAVAEEGPVIMEGTAKFAGSTAYKATTTLQAHGYYLFPVTEEFRNAVKENVSAGKANADVTVAVSEGGERMTVEVSYPAVAEEDNLTVSFDANVGSDKVENMPAETNVDRGGQLAKPAKEPKRTGYVFKGWSSTPNGADIVEWPQTIEADTTFYAVWEEEAVTPTCTCSIAKVTISGGSQITIPATAESGTLKLNASADIDSSCQMEGHPGSNAVTYAYAVKEGAENNTAGASVDASTGLVTATHEGTAVITVTATLTSGTESGKSKTEEVTITVTKAEEGTCLVSFDANAGSDKVDGMPANATVESGKTLAKPVEMPTRTGYVFKGWSKTADGAAIADADWPQTIEADTTFYAVWESEAATPGECTCGITKVTISGGSRITIPATAESGTLQLGASAEVGSCQVEGHPDGNTVTYAYAIKEGAENNTAGASVDASTGLVTATREGKAVITVTATLATGTESGKSKTEEVTITVTKAEEGTCVVSFDANAGGDKVDGMPEEASVESGKTLAKPAEVPTRAGHVFKGWSRTADGAVIADADWPQTIEADTTFYAVWEKESGNITQEEAEAAMTEAISAAERLLKFAQGNYTAESWAVFEAAYNAAKNPAAGISAAELKQLADNLASAQGQLVLDQDGVVENANKTIAAADAKFAEVSKGTKAYEAGSWAAYQTAYEALKKAIAENADAETLNGLYQALAEAESLLKEDTAWMDAKGALTKALKTAKPKHDKGAKAYTSATWKPFKTAYDNANKQKNATASSCTASKLKQLAERLDSTRKALKNAPVLKKGDSIVKNNVKYVVTNASKKTVRAEGVKSKKNKKFSVNILSTVTIKGFKCNVTEVKAKAFYKFTKITKVTIGKKVTKIGKQAFEGCKAVTTLTVSGDVKTFDKQSFNGCKKLKKVVFKGKKVPAFKSKAFKGTASNMRVTLNKKMSKKNKAKMKTALKKAGVSKNAKIK